MSLWGQSKILFYFFATGLLLLAYNNCGQNFKSFNKEDVVFSKAGAFWPNDSTTLLDSTMIKTGLINSDIDGDGVSESIFVSDSEDYVSPVQDVIRVIDSINYKELLNIHGMKDTPTHQMNVLLVDIDNDGSDKELLYVNKQGNKLIAIDVFSNEPHKYRWEIDLLEKITFSNDVEMYVQYGSVGMQIIVGNNMVYNPATHPQIDYFHLKIDGGWTEYTEWSSCSRLCGGGMQVRMRACSSPMPQNGGAACAGSAIHNRACNTQICDTNCPSGQVFEVDRCVTVTEDASGQTSSVGGTSGGVGGTGGPGGTGGGNRCNGGGMAYNPATDSCVVAEIGCTVPNGVGIKRWLGRTYGACTDVRCVMRGTVLVNGNRCMYPRTFFSNDNEQLNIRTTATEPLQAVANRYCESRGYELARSYSSGGRIPVRQNQGGEGGPTGPVLYYLQRFTRITCVK